MDLSKLQNEKKLILCKTYYKIGYFLLPFVWLVNAIWFFNEGFRKPEFEEQKEIKKYVIYSAIGTSIWFIAIVIWIIVFQLNRANWGEYADYISFIIPVGIP
ncbi:gamma-secretase subunit pen-2 [Diorhabda carinulata]|uniref:gamma-secretase subunit pen-2 n=1 Tax=Diorhabda sublineata TaxID=1163346 RepID=UPI0024E0EBFE|nr:gamma-secretase subunit pen-2 [Diorhabda sublineata]XP_057669692.1 gamma-secretase subunit pen-2 [Diorhabda carinulata]